MFVVEAQKYCVWTSYECFLRGLNFILVHRYLVYGSWFLFLGMYENINCIYGLGVAVFNMCAILWCYLIKKFEYNERIWYVNLGSNI